MMMAMKQPLLITFFFFFSTTGNTLLLAQQISPVQPPTTSSSSSSQGFSTVPLVPSSPNGAPTPASSFTPKTPTIDIVQILTRAKRFSVLIRLLKTTQLINQLNSQLITTTTTTASSNSGGLTMFAPEDSAFNKLKPGFLNSLTDREKVELLQFHTLSSAIAISNFDTLTNPVQTQAGDDAQRLQLNVTTYGASQVKMTTGAVNASVIGTVYTDNKLAIYEVDKVLLPLDLVLPKAKAPAPAKGEDSRTNSSSSSSSSGSDKSGAAADHDGSVPLDSASSSSSYLRFKVLMWLPLLLLLGATI